MTTIAWDMKFMAADRLYVSGGIGRLGRSKLVNTGRYVAGAAGDTDFCVAFLEWFKAWAKDPTGAAATFPDFQRADSTWVQFFAVDRDNVEIVRFEQTPIPIRYPNQLMAIGSGGNIALGAMAAGACATRAVQLAGRYDIGTGSDDITTVAVL